METMWEPRKEALGKISQVINEPEMSEYESAFLCGLIKEKKPHKILEVGVAAGGTTAIIIQCLHDLGMVESEFISVDLNDKFYRGDGRDTGFLGAEIKKHLTDINHRFIFGHVLAGVIDEVGDNIDLVILDTVHYLPGEVLDYPVLLPYLSENAIVVLHDIVYSQYGNKEGIATQVLLDVATGYRIVPRGLDRSLPNPIPNIAAIQINEDSKRYIDAVFYSMILPWHYVPHEAELTEYREFYNKFYDGSLVDIFEAAVMFNKAKKIEKKDFKNRIICAARMIIKGY